MSLALERLLWTQASVTPRPRAVGLPAGWPRHICLGIGSSWSSAYWCVVALLPSPVSASGWETLPLTCVWLHCAWARHSSDAGTDFHLNGPAIMIPSFPCVLCSGARQVFGGGGLGSGALPHLASLPFHGCPSLAPKKEREGSPGERLGRGKAWGPLWARTRLRPLVTCLSYVS